MFRAVLCLCHNKSYGKSAGGWQHIQIAGKSNLNYLLNTHTLLVYREDTMLIQCQICQKSVNAKCHLSKYCSECAQKRKSEQYEQHKATCEKNKQKSCQICNLNIKVEYAWTRYCPTCSKELQLKRCKNYKQKHKTEVKKYNKKYKDEHESKLREQRKQYNIANRAIIREKVRGYRKKYHEKYPQAHLFASHRGRVNNILKSKRKQFAGSKELIGCSKQMLQAWIEFQFNSDQTFENYGKLWHLDHCIPCTKFNAEKHEDIKKCFHWSNLQPLNANKNLSKNNKTSLMEQLMQELKVHVFLKQNKIYKNYTVLNYNRALYV